MPPHRFTVRLFHPRKAIALSDILPLAENLGLRVLSEAPFRLADAARQARAWRCRCCGSRPPTSRRSISPRPARASWRRSRSCGPATLENDGLNKLVLKAGLRLARGGAAARLRQVPAPGRHCRSARTTWSARWSPIRRSPAARSSCSRRASIPALGEASRPAQGAHRRVEQQIADGTGGRGDARRGPHPAALPQRRAAAACAPTTGIDKEWISFKVDSRTIDELPAPRPLFEIFVYSPRMEGIHLRGGRVARGGIRWSDRREDFRTEILGLMKTQMVKNAVIVPAGSKGGFYVKRPPLERHARAGPGRGHRLLPDPDARAARHHRQLRRAARSCRPPMCVRHDGDDPYLVVAADKGTATFSDIANALARDYGFWLDDAFASGGSAGYDHKKMGITARGAWESVKRHFRELGTDIQTTPFTVVGVGDMSGDVFGNGMLLVAADQAAGGVRPSPHLHRSRARSGALSWAERKRLFDLPRSSWMDYDKSLISAGRRRLRPHRQVDHAVGRGERGAGHRAAGDDADRPDARHPQGAGRPALFRRHRHLCEGVEREPTPTPATAPTMRSASTPTDLRAKVIGEGANLGFTQRGRVEAALARAQDQHRRARQFGRRRHLGPRGQHQDRDRRGISGRWPRRPRSRCCSP